MRSMPILGFAGAGGLAEKFQRQFLHWVISSYTNVEDDNPTDVFTSDVTARELSCKSLASFPPQNA